MHLASDIREQIIALATRHGAEHVRVFGSVAQGTRNATSDLDLLVDFAPDRSLLDHVALQQDLEAALGISVDVVTERSLHPHIRFQHVLKEAVAL